MKRVTPSMVISSIALFVALSGTGIAATQALIGSKQIADHSIRLVDINGSAVRALRGQRGPAGAAGAAGATGPVGPTGPQGPAGAQGPAGPQGLAGANGSSGENGANGTNGTFDPNKIQYVVGPEVAVMPDTEMTAEADCPAGTTAISGGFFSNITDIFASETFGKTFHAIGVFNTSAIEVTVHATVVCAA